MLHVLTQPIPQRGNLCLQCRRHQCLLCLRAPLLWRWDCLSSSSSSSTAPTSAPVATPPHFPPAPASSLYATLQPSAVGWNGWATSAKGANLSQMCLYANESSLKSFNSCSVCRVRMMCLPDLLYLNSTVLMSIPLLCPLCPGSQRSSGTLLYEASNDSQTSANGTERLASTVMGTVRYRRCETRRHSCSTSAKLHSDFSVSLRWSFGLSWATQSLWELETAPATSV